MSRHGLPKRVRGHFSSRRQPSSCPSGQPSAVATSATELHEKVQGRLHRAAARGDLAWLRRWRWYYKRVGIDPPDQQRRTPLHLASENGHADIVRYLAGKNCKLNLADDLKRTPLMRAVQCQQEECVTILLEHGADPNLADADGNTALHLAVLSGNTTVTGLLLKHNASSDAQNQGGYTPLNLAVSRGHEGMLECLLKKAADAHAAEQCERTAFAVSTSHEADVEEDNLRLQEELEKVKVELREMEEKYLNSERYIQNMMAAVEKKDKEELAVALELQDQLSAYLEKQTTVEQLKEHMQRLEINKTCLEATVHQNSNRIDALLRDLQASASLREMEEKYLNSERCVQHLMTALDAKDKEELPAAQKLQDQLSSYFENQTTVKQLDENVQFLEMKNTCLEATVHQQNNRIEALQRDLQASASLREMEEKYLNSERCVQDLMALLDEKEKETTASALKLQDQVSQYLETVKQLEEHMQRLAFEKTCLEETVQQQSNRIEALLRDLQASTSAQADTQDFIRQRRASYHASLRNQLEDRIADLECQLYRMKDTLPDSTFQKQRAQAEVEKYKALYQKEAKISKCQAKELERAKKRLEEANAKLLGERHKSKLSVTSSIVSGGLAATPVLYSTAWRHLGMSSGLDSSLSLEGRFLSQCEKILSSRKRIVASVAKAKETANPQNNVHLYVGRLKSLSAASIARRFWDSGHLLYL